jgi:hypothetical protein
MVPAFIKDKSGNYLIVPASESRRCSANYTQCDATYIIPWHVVLTCFGEIWSLSRSRSSIDHDVNSWLAVYRVRADLRRCQCENHTLIPPFLKCINAATKKSLVVILRSMSSGGSATPTAPSPSLTYAPTTISNGTYYIGAQSYD